MPVVSRSEPVAPQRPSPPTPTPAAPLQQQQQHQHQQQRPRVSFNRDVHVKRIGNGAAPRVVPALSVDPSGRLQPLAVRRERTARLSRRDIAKEAQRVLEQAGNVVCVGTATGLPPTTLPPNERQFNSLPNRRKKHRGVKLSGSFRGEKPVKEGTSSSSPDRQTSVKRPRIVTRSASDVGRDKAAVDDKTKFWSLDRLRSRKNKADKVRKVQSDTEPTPIPSILSKKSHSDTEKRPRKNSDSEASSAKKKQLSPIIEASPREDYFEPVDVVDKPNAEISVVTPELPRRKPKAMDTLHSSQTIAKPVLTRGFTVDSMVRKLSQDRAGRGPPRVVSPLGIISPGEHNKHNNNLPFSYTEPNSYGHEYDAMDKLAEPARPTRVAKLGDAPTESAKASPTGGVANGDQVIYAEVVCNGGGKPGSALTKHTVHTSVAQSKAEDGKRSPSSTPVVGEMPAKSKEYVTEYSTRISDYSAAEGRGRADGMDARRGVYDDESYRRVSPVRRNLIDDFIGAESGKFHDDIIEPVLRPTLINGADLSSRRDRLQSRIESQRKDRLMSSRLNEKSYRSHHDVNEAIIDNVRKYPSNPRLDSDATRREFLHSQLDYENGLLNKGSRYDPDVTQFGRSVDHIDKYVAPKGDKFTDSGIDITYPAPGGNKVILQEVTKSYHNTYHTKGTKLVDLGGKSKSHYNSQPTLTNITKVDVNGHIKPGASDDDVDDDDDEHYFYNQQENVDQIKAKRAAFGAKSDRNDCLPSSSVLIRNYDNDRHDYGGRSTKRKEFDERRDLDEDYNRRSSFGMGDIEETRRFLVEERRRCVDERKGSDYKPEKVRTTTLKKKQGPIEKVKAYFSRSDAKKKSVAVKKEEVDPLTSRYSEYRGSRVDTGSERTPSMPPKAPVRAKNSASSSSQMESSRSSSSRRERLATPSPSPSRPNTQNSGNASGSWFKSLDRLTSRKNKPKPKLDQRETISENDELKSTFKHSTNNNVDKANKNLRFFGDTDGESVRSAKPIIRTPMTTLAEHPPSSRYNESNGSTSTTRYVPLRDAGNNRRYKSSNRLQVPRRRHHRSAGELATSSAESTTEGDSSQQSQRSVVYLHAATVGDIPGRTTSSRNARRARSREELSSTTGSNLTPQTRTVSRSISVLAPWKPRHYRQPMEVHYENDSDLQGRGAKPPKVPNYKTSSSTLNRINNKEKSYNSLSRNGHKDKENRRSMNSLNRKEGYQKSTDSLNIKAGSRRDLDSTTSYERGSKSRIGNGTSDGYRNGVTTLKKTKTTDGQKRADLSRSMSMPKDAKVKSGWFRLRKK